MNPTIKRIVAFTTLISFTASNTLAAIPNLQSIQGINPDGRYNSGDTIEITANFDDFVSPSPQSELSLTLDVGPTTVNVPLTFSSDSLRDTSFGIAGVDNATGYGDASSEGIVMATELKQGDNAGRIIIVGSFTSYEGTSGVAKILVLNPDGTIYKSFLNTASEFTNAIISTVYETSEGKILVGGEFENAFGNADYDFLVQLNADFTIDTDFMGAITNNSSVEGFNGQVGSSGTANGASYYSANTPIVEHNGRLYIGGDFTQVGGEDYDHVTCLNLDGTFCAGFSSPFTTGIRAMSLAVDGDKLWVAGQNMYAGSYQDLWRLNLADGSVDNTYVHRLAGDLIGGLVVLPEVADGGTGGLAISGNSLDMDAHVTSTDNTVVAAVNNRPLIVINDDGTMNTLWDVQGNVFQDEPWSGEGFQILKDKLFFGMHYLDNDLSANDVRDSAGYYASIDTVECPRNNVNGSTYTTDSCGLSPLMVFNLNDGSINAEFMDVVGPLGSFLNARGADDIHDFELLDDGGLLIVGSFGGYRATGTTDAYDESMILKFRFDQLTGTYTVGSTATDDTGLVLSTGISSYQVSNIFESTSDTDGDAAYTQLVANNQVLQDNSRYSLNRGAASSVELYADDNTNPAPTLTDYSDLGVTGVTAANLDEINAVVDSLEGSDVDTAAKVQQVVDVYSIVSVSDDPADGGFTATDLTDIGLTDVSDRQLENYEVAIASASPAPATLAELQAIIDDVNSQLAYPGGVSGTLFWLRADETLLADGSNVTSVSDYNIPGRSLSATQGGGVTFDATLQNFNPGYVSDGTDLFTSQDSWIMTGNGDRSSYIVGSTANSADGWSYIFGMGSGNEGESFDFGKVFGSEQLIATAHNGYAPIDNIWITDQVSFAYAQYDNSIPELAASGNGSAFTRINPTTSTTQKLSLFAGSRNNETWNGSVGEVIIWEKVLSDNERQRVDSYLAVKFGITLNQDGAGTEDGNYLASDSTVIWDETIAAGYSSDIFGLGKDIGSDLNQKVSKSVNANTVLTLATSADFSSSNIDATRTNIGGNRSFIMLSNNGAATSMQTTEKSVDYIERTSREWLVQRSGYAQALSMKFDGFGSTAATSYVVLVDADGDFSAGSTVLGALDANGEVTLTDAQVQNLANGSYITLAVIDQDVLASKQALAEVLEDSNSVGGADNANGSAVTIAQLNDIQGLTNVIAGNEAAYQDAINAETGFSNPPTVAEVQAIIDAVNASANVLQQIGNEADSPDTLDSTVTVAQLQTIVPAITDLVAGNEALYQDYIDENPASFSSPATAAEVQAMVDAVNTAVNTSNSVLAQIGNEGDNPDVVDSVVTVAQIQTIIPEITGVVVGNEALYQDYIDANPDSFSAPATAAEVQAMITAVNDAVNASNAVLTQIGNEGDEPDTVTSVVTVAQMQTIIPEITGLDANNQSLYQNYIDENPGSFSSPATAAEVQAMVDAVNDAVNTSNSVLAQIGNEADTPDTVDSVVTVAQIQTIIPEITGVVAGNEALYQDYIDANPDAFSAPATAAEVQAMVDAVNAAAAASNDVLTQIGNEGDNPDVVNSVVTVSQIQTIIPEITGVVAGNEALYQDYIDANPDAFSAPATAAEVQAMITAVNDAVTTSNDVLTQIGNEGDNPDVVDSVVTVAQIQTIIPEITGVVAGNEALYQNYIDENPDAFSAPATAADVQAMINAVNGSVSDSDNVLAQIGNEADDPDTVNSVVTVTQLQQIIPALTGLVPGNEAEYQNYIDANPTLFSSPATAAEVQDMVDAVNAAVSASDSVLTQIGNEADNPDVVDSVVTVAQIQTIIPEITGVVADNEALYQDYIDANPDAFSAPATAAEVQSMINNVNAAVNTSNSVLEQIGNEGDTPDVVNSVVTVSQIQTIIPEITGVVAGNEALYQDYIDENPDAFSAPATAAEVQDMITAVNDAVNTSNSVLEQIGNEADSPDAVDSVVTVEQIQTIIPEITGVVAGNEALYQDYIDENPDAFSAPATAAEVQAMITAVNDAVNTSNSVLEQIGNEGDSPDAVNSVVTVAQIQTIIPEITGVVAGNESLYQDYIDENPDAFSAPATAAEVQAMVDAVNAAVTASNNVLAQIGNEGDDPDVVDSVVTVAQIQTIIPEITGVVADNEALYQDYIDANPDAFSAPATSAEVQSMINNVNAAVNTSNSVLEQIGNEGDAPDVVNSVVTVSQIQTIIPEITGVVAGNEALYQDYIDENPDAFSAPATAAEVQDMITAVNDAVNTSNSVLEQIGNEGDNPDAVNSVVTVAQIQQIIPEITGVVAGNESLYQDYIDENPDAFSAPATAAEVQAMITAVNDAVNTSNSVLEQIGNEGDSPDAVNSVVTVEQIQQIIPEITGVVAGNEALYQDYIDENPDAFSAPATAAEVQAMVDAVNDAVTTSNDVLAQIGNEGDNPDVVDSVVTVAQIQTIIPEITGVVAGNEALYQDYIDANPDSFSAPATAAEVQAMVTTVNADNSTSEGVLAQIGNEADDPDVVDSVVTVAQMQQIIPAITGLVSGNESFYEDYIDENPTAFSAPATAAEVQAMVDAVNAAVAVSDTVLQQIAAEGDNPDVNNSVVTVAQIQTIIPEITGVIAGNESLYQDYIDENPDSFTEGTATAAEVQAMITAVNDAVTTSNSVLAQIGNEGDNPDAVDSVVTVAQIQSIIPEITDVVAGNEALYQDYIDENPDAFSAPATAAEVQAMVDAVNSAVTASNDVLAQIGNEGDDPDVVDSVVTVGQIQTIIPEITGVIAGNESLYQDYIDANPGSFSAPATAAEVQAMINNVNAAVNTSTSVLEQIGNEGDDPDVVNSVVTVSQIQTIIPEITGVVAGNEALYQDYIDENPDSFSAPATAAEVQAMITAVNDAVTTSNDVLAQIGNEGDNPDVVDSVVTVAQIQSIIPEITGVVAANEALYQDYIDENPDAFSAPATATEVQNMVSIVNASNATSESVLAQIGNEADDPDVVDSVVTVPQMQQIIPEITGLVPANQAEYQNYIDNNPNAISSPATAAEVQDVIDAVNAAVAVSDTVLAQIGNEGDNPDVVNSVVTVAQIETILPTITGVVAGNEALYQDYIDANPDSFSAPATAAEVQSMINNVNAAVNTSTSVLEQIGNEGDNPDVVNSVVTVPQLASIIPEITGLVPGNEAEYQNYIDANPDAFSAPATAAEVQDLVDTVNAAVATSTSVLAQIGNEGDNPDVVDSVVTVAQMQTIIPEITGLIAGNEALYQGYIDANPDSFSAPATAAEVQSMVNTVNADNSTSESVLAQIGNEADNPDVVNSVVTVPQLASIIPEITGLVPANEAEYQNYIDENPDAISAPATAAEVQDVIDAVNAAVTASTSVLAQIGNEGDNPDVVDSVVTVAQMQTILPAITGLVAGNEGLYQDYIDANPDNFSAPATAGEVQAMVNAVNATTSSSASILAQIGNEADNPDVVESVVTVAQMQQIVPAIIGLVGANQALYQDYIDENPDNFSAPATVAEVQAMITAVNDAVNNSNAVLAQIGREGDAPDLINSVVTVTQISQIIPEITGLVPGNEAMYQNYIDENPDRFSAPATPSQVQLMVDRVNEMVAASTSVLAQIGREGDNPDTVNSVISVAEMERIIPAITGLVPANQSVYQDYIDANPDNFSVPATAAEVQAMVDAVNAAVIQSATILAQIGSEADEPDTVESVVTVEQLLQILPVVDGVVEDNEALYQAYIDSRPNAFSEPATVGQVQIMIDRVNASQEALLEILEDSASEDGANNANGDAVTVQEIASITGITGVNFDLEDEYQAAIAAETGFSNPPTLEEVQAVIDQVNAANSNQAPGNPGTDEVAPDGTLEFSKSAGSVSLLWIMLAMLLVLARVQPRGLLNVIRNRRWLAPAAALLAVSSASVAEESKDLESLWVLVPASETATTEEAPEEFQAENKRVAGEAEDISRLYLTGGGLYSQFSPDSDGVDITSESDTGLGLGLGYDITDQLSFEASYLSHGEFRVENNADGSEAALDYSSANIRLNWFPKFIGNKERHAGFSRDGVLSWYLSAGLNYVMGDVTGPVDIDKEQSVVFGYGAGIAYGVTDQLDTFLSYNRISGDLDAISAGVRFHFGLEQPAGRSVPLAVPTVTAFVEPTVLSTPQPEMAILPDCVSCTPVGSVFFAFDSSAISDEFHPMLEELLQRISNDEFRGSILITGFADSLGSSDYNLALAHRRAKAVSDYLVEHGLDRFLIDVESEGRLLTPNILEASKRRADIFVKNADMKPVSWID